MILNDADDWTGKGTTLLKLEKYEEALNAYEKAIELSPENTNAWAGKSTALFGLERYEEALNAYEKLIESNPEYVHAFGSKGAILLVLERYEEALKTFKKAIELSPENTNYWTGKGVALVKLEEYEEALNAYEKAIELSPENTNAWTGKGVALVKHKKYEKALNVYEKALNAYEKAIELDSKNVNAHINLGELFYDFGNLKASSKEVDVLLSMDENNASALSLQGRIYIENKDYSSAAKCFEHVLSLGIHGPVHIIWDVYANYLNIEFSPISKIGKEYQKKENIALIIRKLERAKKISNIHDKEEVRAYILYFLGYFYYKIDDIFTAKETLEECIKLKSTIKKPARQLLENIWEFQIRPTWIKWWLASPIYRWEKRNLFLIISGIIFIMFLYPIINPEVNTNWTLYYCSIIILIAILISNHIKRFKTKEFEIEMHSPPPFEFTLSPSTMELNIENLPK